MMNESRIQLKLTIDQAIVLFEFVSRFTDLGLLNIEDQAEERVLWDICAFLEKQLTEPFDPNWETILQNARNAVRD